MLDISYIFIDYYIGAYGPTIMVRIETDEMLKQFYAIIESLISEETINLCTLSSIKMENLNLFELVYQAEPVTKNIIVGKNREAKWLFDKSSRDNCMGLLEGLFDGLPGHQYLNSEGHDDALIELSFKENLRKKQ